MNYEIKLSRITKGGKILHVRVRKNKKALN